ncbi:hypothetical protein [Candidatus Paracaedibacter symbiosus]|uniref:hypothetical protein n=1 Tax=Candidatus Paracaedibacter symbiosus TaxID=244582 RepID=UPI000509536C|nr:hypothetical protein [Candidatus Paracaedibacter symbiosus]
MVNFMSFSIEFLTISILIGGLLAAIFIKPDEFKNTRTSVFVSIMSSMAVIVLGFNVYVSTVGLQNQRSVTSAQFTKDSVDKMWLLPNNLLTEKKHARSEFLSSFYYNNISLYNLTKDLHTEETIESALEEQYIAIVLIQSWEDYLTFRMLDKTGDIVWLCNFLQWAQSPFLRKIFKNLKYNFATTTRDFALLLFEYADRIPVPCTDPEIYNKLSDEMLRDPKLLRIFEARSNKKI